MNSATGWACAACTFINQNQRTECEICNTNRPNQNSAAGGGNDDPPWRGYHRQGAQLSSQGRNPDAIVMFKKAVASFPQERTASMREERARILCDLSFATFQTGDHQNAQLLTKEALDEVAPLSNAVTVEMMRAHGSCCQMVGKLPEAEENFKAALALAKRLGNPDVVMGVLAQLSGVIIRQGKLNEGMLLMKEGLTMATSSTQLTNSEQGVMRQMLGTLGGPLSTSTPTGSSPSAPHAGQAQCPLCLTFVPESVLEEHTWSCVDAQEAGGDAPQGSGLPLSSAEEQLLREAGRAASNLKDAQLLDKARELQVRASNLGVSQKWAEAESAAREALDALRAMETPDFDLRSKMLTQISGYLGKQAKWKEAVSFCRESLELSKAHQEITQTPMEALMFWSSYGIALCKAKEFLEGIDAVRAAVQLAVARPEMVDHARNLRVVAWGCLQDISPVVPLLTLLSYEQSAPVVFDDAMQIFDRAIALFVDYGDKDLHGQALLDKGRHYRRLRDHRKSLECFEQAFNALPMDDKQRRVMALSEMARVHHFYLGSLDKAVALLRKAKAISAEVGPREQCFVFGDLGNMLCTLRKNRKGRKYLKRAVAISRSLPKDDNNPTGHILALIAMDLVAVKPAKAICKIDKAIKVQPPRAHSTYLHIKATAQMLMGQLTEAWETLQTCLALAEEFQDDSGRLSALVSTGRVELRLGNYHNALTSALKAEQVAQRMENGGKLCEALLLQAEAHEGINAFSSEVVTSLQRAREAMVKMDDRRALQLVRGKLAWAYLLRGRAAVVVDMLEKKASTPSSNPSTGPEEEEDDWQTLTALGTAYSQQRRHDKALDCMLRAYSLISAPSGEWVAPADKATQALNVSMCYLSLHNLQEAVKWLKHAAAIFDEGQRNVRSNDSWNQSVFSRGVLIFEVLQLVQAKLQNIEESLETCERTKGRATVDLLLSRDPRLQRPVSENSREQFDYHSIRAVANRMDSTIITYSIVDSRYLEDEPNSQLVLLAWAIPPSPDKAVVFHEQSLNQEVIGSTLLEFILGMRQSMGVRGNCQGRDKQEQTRGGATSISKEFLLASMLKMDSDDPTSMWDEKLTRNFVLEDDEEEQFEEENNSLPKLRTLFDLLIRPFTDLLHSGQSSNRLVFVPCGDLFLVPFAALVDSQDNDSFLIEKYTISVVPCIQLLDLLPVAHHEQEKRPSKNAVVIGDPQNHGWQRLPGARKESETIAQLLESRVILGAEATKEVAIKEMRDKHLIHFAGHGMADRLPKDALLHPTVSGALVLSCGEEKDPDEGLLWAADIEKLQLMPGSLVVLSGCSTGRGFKISNDGVAGLARAFLSCGASTLVVSLWAIQDHYTLELMTQFYHCMLDEGLDVATAMRNAMLTMIAEDKESGKHALARWAAFIVVGRA